jgi:transketolase
MHERTKIAVRDKLEILMSDERHDCRDAFATAVETLAAGDPRVVALVNDSVSSTKLGGFARRFPDRFFNIGIAEQNLVGIGSGLANAGKIPFVCCASCFLTARAMEQIKVDLAYSDANVKLGAMSPGMAYGPLGATHHAIEDLAWMRVIPNLTVINPADPEETAQAVRAAANHDGPVFLRINRTPVPAVHSENYRFVLGRASRLRSGSDLTIIAIGTMVAPALQAAALLAADAVQCTVLNMASLNPLDLEAIAEAAEVTGAILTVEEHSVRGGLGSAVAEAIVQSRPAPMRMLGVPGVFAPTGSHEWLCEHFGLTPAGIRRAALELLERKESHERLHSGH